MALSLKRRSESRPKPDSMTLVEHLTELRRRVLICALAFAVAATVAFLVYPWILSFLKHPYCQVSPRRCGFYITGPLDGLALRVKIAAYGGLFLASPVLLWELWRFITPGLNPKEKRYAIPFIVASIVLFALGCLVAYVTFPHALQLPRSHRRPAASPQILDPTKYLSLIVLLMTVFGLTFEFPVLLVSLELAGVLSPKQLSSWRRWAIVLIVVVAGVITPSSDPFSMMALAIPLYVFYELSIVDREDPQPMTPARAGDPARHAGGAGEGLRGRFEQTVGFPLDRVPASGHGRHRPRGVGAGVGPDRLGQDPDRRLRRGPGPRRSGARRSTRRRSRPCPTRSSPSSRPGTGRTGSAS